MPLRLKEMIIDPITRIEGHLGLRLVIDADARKPVKDEVRSFVTMFRGFEVFTLGRPPEDAVHITSRICGVCGASHANADVVAADIVYGVAPQPMGVALRNLAFAATDHIYDHSIILNMLEGPDFSEVVVSKLTPSVWREAERTLAEHRDVHGFTTIADIMKALNPINGVMWKLALKYQRIAREAGVLIYGRHSHPSTLIPGGISTDLTNAEYLLMGYAFRLTKLTAWAKFNFYVWHDLLTFYENIGYGEQGKTYDRITGVSTGLFDDPAVLGSIGYAEPEDFYAMMDEVAASRLVKPGIIIDGELVSTKYTEISASHMEHVEKSFYEEWGDKVRKLEFYSEEDPIGNKLLWGHVDPVYHPWNKITVPKRSAKDWASKYSWATTVRLVWKNGKIIPFEVGPIIRLKVTALVGGPFGGVGKLKVSLPRSGGAEDLPPAVTEPMDFEWVVPDYSSTTKRLYARAFNLLIDIAAAWMNLENALYLAKQGRIETSNPWKPPERITRGFGSVEAPRGAVRHWMVQKGGKILNLQIQAPTTSNVSPSDKYGMSPFELAAANTVVTEETPPEQWTGLDFVRAIRSFDPCLACAVHSTVLSKGRKIRLIRRLITPACTV